MATKKKKAPAKKRKAPVAKKEVLSAKGRDERFLEILIAASRKHIDGTGSGIDELFKQQTARLEAELAELRSRK